MPVKKAVFVELPMVREKPSNSSMIFALLRHTMLDLSMGSEAVWNPVRDETVKRIAQLDHRAAEKQPTVEMRASTSSRTSRTAPC